jgi:hypothetical protein
MLEQHESDQSKAEAARKAAGNELRATALENVALSIHVARVDEFP